MKHWNRWILGGLVLILALGLCAGKADAATKAKKKKKAAVSEPAPASESTPVRSSKRFLQGSNIYGRSGLFFGDTSGVAPLNQVEGAVHFTFSQSSITLPLANAITETFTYLSLPFGAHLGVDKDFEVSAYAQVNMTMDSGYSYVTPPVVFPGPITVSQAVTVNVPSSTATSFPGFGVGGKYQIKGDRHMPDFSVGGDVFIPTLTGGTVIATPRGTVTYVLPSNGLLLNGDFGVHITTITYVSVDAGVGYPLSKKFSIIGELGANQYGYTASEFGMGVRADLSGAMGQVLLGVPLNGGGVLLAAGILF